MKEELLNILRPYDQEHLVSFWDELDEKQQLHLATQVKGIDLARVAEMYSQCCDEIGHAKSALRAGPPVAVRMSDLGGAIQDTGAP